MMSRGLTRLHSLLTAVMLSIVLAGCGTDSDSGQETADSTSTESVSLSGQWRGVLSSPGGELPFLFELHETSGAYRAVITNGDEAAPVSSVAINGNEIEIDFDWYDSEIIATLSDDRSVMKGRWRKTSADKDTVLDFAATRGVPVRFMPQQGSANDAVSLEGVNIDGSWRVEFTDEDGTELAVGQFRQQGEILTGTFMTPTGDYRFLEGDFVNGLLRLSTFDGAHAFLFSASINADGSLTGDFWSRDTYHATWQATSTRDVSDILPDAWSMVEVTTEDKRIAFSFEDLDEQMVSLSDDRFAGKPVLVNLFGSWCPNCNDEAPVLADIHRKYAPQGLEIIGLAFEYTGDVVRDREQVGKFRDRYGLEYPLLLAGMTDKAGAAETLGFLDKVVAYPTTIFLDRNHDVVGIHSGFAGPGTGEYFDRLVAELNHQVEQLVADPESSASP